MKRQSRYGEKPDPKMAVIEMLEAENKDLKKNPSLAGSRQNELKDSSITKQFEVLIERRLDYERLIAEEQQVVSELERRIRERQQQIVSSARTRVGS